MIALIHTSQNGEGENRMVVQIMQIEIALIWRHPVVIGALENVGILTQHFVGVNIL